MASALEFNRNVNEALDDPSVFGGQGEALEAVFSDPNTIDTIKLPVHKFGIEHIQLFNTFCHQNWTSWGAHISNTNAPQMTTWMFKIYLDRAHPVFHYRSFVETVYMRSEDKETSYLQRKEVFNPLFYVSTPDEGFVCHCKEDFRRVHLMFDDQNQGCVVRL
jgi:hypothetical protein